MLLVILTYPQRDCNYILLYIYLYLSQKFLSAYLQFYAHRFFRNQVTIQPFGFIETKASTQAARTAVWRVAASGLPCKCKAAPRGTVES